MIIDHYFIWSHQFLMDVNDWWFMTLDVSWWPWLNSGCAQCFTQLWWRYWWSETSTGNLRPPKGLLTTPPKDLLSPGDLAWLSATKMAHPTTSRRSYAFCGSLQHQFDHVRTLQPTQLMILGNPQLGTTTKHTMGGPWWANPQSRINRSNFEVVTAVTLGIPIEQ